MIARIAYAFREMWASFRRNLTLTAAAILTSAIALLLVGTTMLIQRAFENLLVQWKGDVAMIVFVRSDATPEQIALIDESIRSAPTIINVDKLQYLDKTQTYEEAKRIFAGDPVTLSLLTPENIPSEFKVVPITQDPALVRSLSEQYRSLPGVEDVALAEDEFEVISTLSKFVRTVTLVMSLVLLVVAVGLIWNTIRTAMFARRREIEVMKLVGASSFSIQLPFLLEGVFSALIGWGFATGLLSTFKYLIDTRVAPLLTFTKFFGWDSVWVASGYLLLTGVLVATVASFVTLRRFVKV